MTRRTRITRPALLALALAGVAPAQAGVTITIAESGGNITMTGSGSINTSGLTSGATGPTFGSYLRATPFTVGAAPSSGGTSRPYSPVTGPANIGSGTTVATGSNTGDIFIIYGGASPALELSSSYTSGASLSFSSTFTGKTLVGMGITPGTYTYTLGNGDTVVVTVNPPPVVNADGTCGTPPGGVTAAGGGTVYTGLTGSSTGLCSAGSLTAGSFMANAGSYTWDCSGTGTGTSTSGGACSVVRGYTVSGTVTGANGTISPTSQVIAANTTGTLTLSPAVGYTASASGCNGSLAGNTFTTGAITADCVVTASFMLNAAPVASNVAITGTPQVGQTLTGGYTYSDTESDAQGTSTFRWLRGTDTTAIATTQTYVPVAADVGNPIKYCVTPVASAGTLTGTEVCSTATAAVLAACTTGATCGTVNDNRSSGSVTDALGGNVNLSINQGTLVRVERVPESGNPASGTSFSRGVFGYTITGLQSTVGNPASLTVTITLPAGATPPTAIYKCKEPVGGAARCQVIQAGLVQVNGNQLLVTLVDNGPLDANDTFGIIDDPIGPAFVVASSGGGGGGFPPVSGGSGGGSSSTGGGSSGTTSGTTSGTSGGTTTTSGSSGGCALSTDRHTNTGLQWLVLLAVMGFIARRRQAY